ncbi:MAG TPA: hypothetical protein VGI14_07900 [Casimicrobiaceae bacterium]|jgi:hypothetical protein
MRSDSSLDREIKMLESRIRDRRVALEQSYEELKHSASQVKERVRERATSPVVWVAALGLGFLAARLARRRPEPAYATLRVGRGDPKQQKPRMLATVLSALLPFGLRMAQQSLAPWIARAMSNRRRAYGS